MNLQTIITTPQSPDSGYVGHYTIWGTIILIVPLKCLMNFYATPSIMVPCSSSFWVRHSLHLGLISTSHLTPISHSRFWGVVVPRNDGTWTQAWDKTKQTPTFEALTTRPSLASVQCLFYKNSPQRYMPLPYVQKSVTQHLSKMDLGQKSIFWPNCWHLFFSIRFPFLCKSYLLPIENLLTLTLPELITEINWRCMCVGESGCSLQQTLNTGLFDHS